MVPKEEVRWKIEHVRLADTMTIFSVTRKESGLQMIMDVVNGNLKRQQTGETACWPDFSELSEVVV